MIHSHHSIGGRVRPAPDTPIAGSRGGRRYDLGHPDWVCPRAGRVVVCGRRHPGRHRSSVWLSGRCARAGCSSSGTSVPDRPASGFHSQIDARQISRRPRPSSPSRNLIGGASTTSRVLGGFFLALADLLIWARLAPKMQAGAKPARSQLRDSLMPSARRIRPCQRSLASRRALMIFPPALC